ncbi:PREDICTED: uncharacterized protein LOC104806801 [Tarenaya hassleriana]|uniref:uncharacterized protein LOC104806801 n=1 Tax=Tarenaya hassleriana TaxID=28532 RepID=UPI00053C3ED7|nr:PREDICTED: uncharacterized protein LOC104806801 [Tarenaya hassleriana]XP_010530174.1 PREDICTED: uncharacterized protein LOC104806801 [Tarenaya hassleriana]
MEMEVSPKKRTEIASADEKAEDNSTFVEQFEEMESLDLSDGSSESIMDVELEDSDTKMSSGDSITQQDNLSRDSEIALEGAHVDSKDQEERHESSDEIVVGEEKQRPVFDGTEIPNHSTSSSSSEFDPDSTTAASAWTEKAAALKNFVRMKSEIAVNSFLRRLSGKRDDMLQETPGMSDEPRDHKSVESPKTEGRYMWNPLTFIKMKQNNVENDGDRGDLTMEASLEPIMMKGRIILYTRLGCEECKDIRVFLHRKRLRYVEINIDIFPNRKLELEKISGSLAVPKIFFNETLIGDLKDLKVLEESGKLEEKINYLITEIPPREAPMPPLSGEDDASSDGHIDELALIVHKMKPRIVKDRFHKMRRFRNCFLGTEAVDFLSEDQYLQREEAIEVARKLAKQLFFHHVLDENLFEDDNHLYRFLDDDPVVSSQCHNIPRGIIDLKPRPISDIASRLRRLFQAIIEAYTSPGGKHVDYRSIHGSEEFARYLRMIQELHRVEVQDMQREEKLAFFINLYNMMAIHAILVLGHPVGPLERKKMFGDFKYVIGGCTYSLSAIRNGIFRANQRPPYNIMKPFGAKDKRSKVALQYTEPLVHFALVFGTRSGPALRCFSPGDIDQELAGAARDFLRGGGFMVDLTTKVAHISKIFQWYGMDFGKNEVEVLKHASNYLEPTLSEALLDLLVDTQLEIIYQPYDWGLNN